MGWGVQQVQGGCKRGVGSSSDCVHQLLPVFPAAFPPPLAPQTRGGEITNAGVGNPIVVWGVDPLSLLSLLKSPTPAGHSTPFSSHVASHVGAGGLGLGSRCLSTKLLAAEHWGQVKCFSRQ